MEASLSLEQIKKIASEMKNDVPVTAIDVERNALLFLFMADSDKVKIIKECKQMAIEIQYVDDIKSFLIFLLPPEYIKDFSPIEYDKYGVCGLVRLDDEKAIELLKKIPTGEASAQFYTFDKNLENISIKPILNTEISRTFLEMELKKISK